MQTSTITDLVTSVVTITPSPPQPLLQQLNTGSLQLEEARSQARPHKLAPVTPAESLDSFETLHAYLDRFQSAQQSPAPASATPPALTTTRRPLIARLRGRSQLRANLLAPKRNLIKERISASLYSAMESASASFSSSTSASAQLQSGLATAAPSSQVTTAPPPSFSVVVSVASSVRVGGGGAGAATDEVAVITASPVTAETATTEASVEASTEGGASSSVVTVYLSGSVPGVFSTSLSTVYYSDGGPQRRRRHATPLDPPQAVILPTRTVQAEAEETGYWELVQSGLNTLAREEAATVTVTTTTTLTLCTPV